MLWLCMVIQYNIPLIGVAVPGVTMTWNSIVSVFSPVLLMKSIWDRSPFSLMARLSVEKLKSAAMGYINDQ